MRARARAGRCVLGAPTGGVRAGVWGATETCSRTRGRARARCACGCARAVCARESKGGRASERCVRAGELLRERKKVIRPEPLAFEPIVLGWNKFRTYGDF